MEETPHTPKKRYNLRKRTNKKKVISSDSESDDEEDSDYVPGYSDDEITPEEEDFNIREWQRFVGKLFPSRATNRRLRALDKLDKYKNKPTKEESKETEDKEEEEEEEEDAEEEYTNEEDLEYMDADLLEDLQNGNMKVNVIFTVAENPDPDYYGDDEDLYYEEADESESEEKPRNKKCKNKKSQKKKWTNKAGEKAESSEVLIKVGSLEYKAPGRRQRVVVASTVLALNFLLLLAVENYM